MCKERHLRLVFVQVSAFWAFFSNTLQSEVKVWKEEIEREDSELEDNIKYNHNEFFAFCISILIDARIFSVILEKQREKSKSLAEWLTALADVLLETLPAGDC